MEGKQMPAVSHDIITQQQLKIGSELMENVSIATRVWRVYRKQLQRRVAFGGTIEPGPLTFGSERIRLRRTNNFP
jgi:hypothetical protein